MIESAFSNPLIQETAIQQSYLSGMIISDQFAIFLTNFYIAMTGYVVGGLLTSGFSLTTGRRLRFEFEDGAAGFGVLIGFLMRIFAGPVIIMRNSISSVLNLHIAPFWIIIAFAISLIWSFCQGVLILDTACRLGACG